AIVSSLAQDIASVVQSEINQNACKQCPSGDVAECGSSFATACSNKVCQQGDQCLQVPGVEGRLRGSRLFGALLKGTGSALDLYEVAGGYSTTDSNGIALGVLGGIEPAGTPRDLCGPAAIAPAPITIPVSTVFQSNTRPDNGQPFEVGVGIHTSQVA